MLVAHGSLSLGPASFRSHIAIDRSLRLFAVERRGVVYDTRVVPPLAAAPAPITLLWFVVSGAVHWHHDASAEGPVAYAMSEAVFEGAHRRRDFTFHAAGEPYVALELRVRGTGGPSRPTRVDLSLEGWSAVRAYVQDAWTRPDTSAIDAASALLVTLEAEGVVEPGAAATLVHDEHRIVRRVWQELATVYGRLDASPSLKRLADRTGLSARHLSRVLGSAFSGLLLPSGGWRDATTDLRLKLALLLLSSPALSVAEVARAVGYGHPEALASAFQRAGAPSPRDVRAISGRGAPVDDPSP